MASNVGSDEWKKLASDIARDPSKAVPKNSDDLSLAKSALRMMHEQQLILEAQKREAYERAKYEAMQQNDWHKELHRQYELQEAMKALGGGLMPAIAPGPLNPAPIPQEQDQYRKILAEWQQAMAQGVTQSPWNLPKQAPAPTPVPARDLPKDFVAGPILAYRAWQVAGGVLKSLNSGEQWLKGEPMKARCSASSHCLQPPVASCSCGLYAWATPENLANSDSAVRGVVALWGKVIKHALGYRAEFAYPWAFLKPRSPMPGFPAMPTGWEPIAEAYGVKIIEMPG